MAEPDVLNSTAQSRLKSFVERVERVDEDLDAMKNDRKEIIAELKGEGFDPKIFAKILRLRKIDRAKRQEEAALIDVYMVAIGEEPA